MSQLDFIQSMLDTAHDMVNATLRAYARERYDDERRAGYPDFDPVYKAIRAHLNVRLLTYERLDAVED